MSKELFFSDLQSVMPRSRSIERYRRLRWAWLSLGANVAGSWGDPVQTLTTAVEKLTALGFRIRRRSRLYFTAPIGGPAQPSFWNAVLAVDCDLPPAALLRALKRLEREAGRRPTVRNGPRPLDLDVLDFGGRRLGKPSTPRRAEGIVLPHPLLARRGFVLVPMREAAPEWRHPLLHVKAETLLHRAPWLARDILAVRDWPMSRE